MRRRAAEVRRPVRKQFYGRFWIVLGGLFIILFLLLFGHDKQSRTDTVEHEVCSFCMSFLFCFVCLVAYAALYNVICESSRCGMWYGLGALALNMGVVCRNTFCQLSA